MDYRQFKKRLSESLNRDPKDVEALIEGFSVLLRESCGDLDTVAIPSFGNFVPQKHDEQISDDLVTGKRMLLPPEIVLEFVPGSMLRKHIAHE